jgi:YggT family protein
LSVTSIIAQVIYLVLYVVLLFVLARFLMSFVIQFARRWRPGRGAAATLEVVWSVTDPPIHALRRVIPPLRVGTVSIDISLMLLLLILYLLMEVAGQLF